MPNQDAFSLSDAAQRQQAVLNALGDGVLVVGRTGEILEANASASRILSMSREGLHWLVPRPPGWVVRNESGQVISVDEMPAYITFRTGRPVRNSVMEVERPDGTRLWLSINTEPLWPDENSLPRAVVVSFHDISELKQSQTELRLREARLSRLLDAVPDLLFVMSNDGVYLDYRASRPELLFFSPAQFLGHNMAELLPPEIYAPCHRVLQETIRSGQSQIVEYDSELLGQRRYFEARMIPFEAGTVLMVVRDITEARQAQQRLQQHEAELAHLGRLGALGAMVAGISHEINQPLHAIANFAAASLNMLDDGRPESISQVRDWLQKIASQSFRASEIVKRFRQFSSPAAHVENVSVEELLVESLDLAAGELRRRGVVVHLKNHANGTTFAGDRIQMQQVLVNFLVNAGEALTANTERDRHVELSARLSDHKLICEVADNGIGGLPAVPPQHLFESFFTTKTNGLGLGLAICRTIIESHGGRIWARANMPRGAIFGFEIPSASK
jgi:two-component system sensor kinase FixL